MSSSSPTFTKIIYNGMGININSNQTFVDIPASDYIVTGDPNLGIATSRQWWNNATTT